MAAVRNGNLSLEDVLNQDIFNTSSHERPPDCLGKVKEALADLAREKGCQNVEFFVDVCAEQVRAMTATFQTRNSTENVPREMSYPINPAPILQREARAWLAGIRRRIGGRRSIRNPFYGEINKDTPIELFALIVRIVRGLHGFAEPFCYHSENTKAIVISFTSMRLVNELFVLLSGLSKDVVAGYFKRSFSGSRKGHATAVLVTEVKDFALMYKKRSGKLVIGFNYGEWNVNGFPQHVC